MFLKQYNQLRRVGMRLSEEIPKTYGLEESLPKIIRFLGIGEGRQLFLVFRQLLISDTLR
jgi:hypothetical protein